MKDKKKAPLPPEPPPPAQSATYKDLAIAAGIKLETPPAPPPATATGATFIVEVFSVEVNAGGQVEIIETGRGSKIVADQNDVKLLAPAPGSRHRRVELQVGKYRYA